MAWDTSDDRYRGVPKHLAERIRKRDGRRCRVCGRHGWQVDHILNVKRGGTDAEDNLQTLCATHHDEKTAAEREQGQAFRRARMKLPQERHPGLL